MAEVTPGKTYVGVTCRKCGQSAPFVEVETRTKLGETGGHFEIECVNCGHTDQYPATELRTMEAHYKQ